MEGTGAEGLVSYLCLGIPRGSDVNKCLQRATQAARPADPAWLPGHHTWWRSGGSLRLLILLLSGQIRAPKSHELRELLGETGAACGPASWWGRGHLWAVGASSPLSPWFLPIIQVLWGALGVHL